MKLKSILTAMAMMLAAMMFGGAAQAAPMSAGLAPLQLMTEGNAADVHQARHRRWHRGRRFRRFRRFRRRVCFWRPVRRCFWRRGVRRCFIFRKRRCFWR
ncbi:MAG: hypothetical protein AAFR04_15180 [Pseudomonadota bacterium]